MKTIKIVSLIWVALLAASSCRDESEGVAGTTPPEEVSVSASLTPTTLGWQAGDRIGLYLFSYGSVPRESIFEGNENMEWTASSIGNTSLLTPVSDSAPRLPQSGTIGVMGYYPYRDDVEYSVYPLDVSDQSDPRAIDLLYARTMRGYGAGHSGIIPVNFSRQLSHLILNVTETSGEGMTGASMTVSGTKTRGWFNLSSGEISYHHGSTADIGMLSEELAGDPSKTTASAILLPAEASAGRKVHFSFPSGDACEWGIPDALTLLSGYVYTYTLNINAIAGTVVVLNASIVPWKEEVPDRVQVVTDGGRTVLTRVGDGETFEGTVSLAANSTFDIEIDGQIYGFVHNSGHGGVGRISTAYTTDDCALLVSFPDYSVEKSFGRLSTTGEPLWFNTGEAADVTVKVDLTVADAIPRYHLAQVKAADPLLILEERFDLITWGGGWVAGKSGRGFHTTNVEAVGTRDGSEPTTGKPNYVTPNGPMNSSTAGNAAYIANAGLSAWDLKQVFLWYGMVMVNNTDAEETGHIITPALSSLTAGTNITVEFDMIRFAKDIPAAFIVEGPGEITAATYHDVIDESVTYATAYDTNKSSTPTAVSTVSADKKSIKLTSRTADEEVSAGISPSFAQQSSSHMQIKYMTRLTVSISGAGPETKLKWTSDPDVKSFRYCIDNIKATVTP